MTRQPHMWDDCTATVTSRQGRLFDPQDVRAGDSALTCCTCGRPMVRTESGYLCCPAGHGRLIHESAADDQDDDQSGDRWDVEAAIIADKHARRSRDLSQPRCDCGACRYTRTG